MATVQDFTDEGLEVWSEPVVFEVTSDRIAQYALATNDPIEAHYSGRLANPVFAIVPVFESMLEPVLEVIPTSLFGLIVHGEQDFRFHRALRPGDVLTSRGKVIGFEGLPNGTRLAIYLECRDEAGGLVNEQYVTCFVRKFNVGREAGELSPGHKLDESLRNTLPTAVAHAHVDDDQTFRYSAAAGDPVPIHLDEQVAIEAGLPGIIAHGLCTLAMASWGLVQQVSDSDVTRVRRIAARFSRIVLPGQDLETRIWKTGVGTYAFETTAGDDLALTDGVLELAE